MYGYFYSPIGHILMESENDSIVKISFLEDEDVEKYVYNNEDKSISICIRQLAQYFDGSLREFDLSLDNKGTEFQREVWAQLAKIPYGQTATYGEIAKNIGRPKACRAVGGANNRNNLSIVVPCHRVVGSNKSLTGYAGGLWRKQWLLDHENKYFGKGESYA